MGRCVKEYKKRPTICKHLLRLPRKYMARPSGEAMNKHIVVEKRPSDWITAALVVWFECGVMFALGYFARPVIESWIGR